MSKFISYLRNFLLKDEIFLFVLTTLSIPFTFLYNTLMARFLGPENMGLFSLVNTVSMFLVNFMLFGIAFSILKFISEDPDKNRTRRIISTGSFLALALIFSVFLTFVISMSFISRLVNIPFYVLFLGALLSIAYALNVLALRVVQGLHRFRLYGVLSFCSSIVMVVVGSILALFVKSFFVLFLGLLVSCVFPLLIVLFVLRDYFRFIFDFKIAKSLMRFGSFAFVGGISWFFLRYFTYVLVNYFFDVGTVGVYSMYVYASTVLSSLFIGVIGVTVLPKTSRHKNKQAIFSRVLRALPLLVPACFILILLIQTVVLFIIGSNYPFIFIWVLLFSLAEVFVILFTIFDQMFASHASKGIKLVSAQGIFMAVTHTFLVLLLIKSLGVLALPLSRVIVYFLGLSIYVLARKRLTFEEVNSF